MTYGLRRWWRSVASHLPGKFIRQSGIYGLGQLVEGLSAAFLLPVFVLYLTPADFAIVSLSEMVGGIISSCWGIRLGPAVTRFYYEYAAEEQRLLVGSLWWAVVGNAFTGLAVWVILGPVILPYFATQVPYAPYLEIIVWTVFARLFAEVPLTLMRIREEAHLVVAAALGAFLLFVGGKLYFVVVAQEGGLGVLKASLWGAGLSALGYCIYMMIQFPLRIHWSYVRVAIGYAWPMTPEAILSGITMVMDRFFLDKWLPLSSIGYYSLASQFGSIAYQAVVSMKMAFVPAVVRIWVQGAAERSKINGMSLLMVAVAATATLAVSLFAQDLLVVIGRAKFIPAVVYIPPLAANAVVVALVTITSMSVVLSKQTRWITAVSLLHGGMSAGVNLLATPMYGVWGVIAASLSGWGSRAVALGLIGRYICPLPIDWNKIWGVIWPILPLVFLGIEVSDFEWRVRLMCKLGILLLYVGYVLALTVGRRDSQAVRGC